MGILGWIFVGLVTGSFAQSVVGVEKKGCLRTMSVGVIGGLLGGLIFNKIGYDGKLTGFNIPSLFIAFIGACLFCFLLEAISRK
jgi:uncharacterized membrane protein YeaQ/YmgE (transglycosylase-associated protein family)